ncbi:unnamed protein product, partial [Prorocentrum cordatum]
MTRSHGGGGYMVCSACGYWHWNNGIWKQKDCCKCGRWIGLPGRKQQQQSPPPRWSTQEQVLPSIQKMAASVKQEQIGKKVERCCWELATAKHRVQDIQARLDVLSGEHLQATTEHAAAVAAAGKNGPSEHALPERLSFNIDPSLFAHMGEADEDYLAAVEALQSAGRALLDEQEKACNAPAELAKLRERARLEEEAKFVEVHKAHPGRGGAAVGGDAEAAPAWAAAAATPRAAEAPAPPTPAGSEVGGAGGAGGADVGAGPATDDSSRTQPRPSRPLSARPSTLRTSGPRARRQPGTAPSSSRPRLAPRLALLPGMLALLQPMAPARSSRSLVFDLRGVALVPEPPPGEVQARGPPRLGPKGPSVLGPQAEKYFGERVDECGVMSADMDAVCDLPARAGGRLAPLLRARRSRALVRELSSWSRAGAARRARAADAASQAAYVFLGCAVGGAVRRCLQSQAACLASLADPRVALAGWSATPAELMRAGFPQKVRGELPLPPRAEATCFKTLSSWRRRWARRRLVAPLAAPTPPRPSQRPDPESKASRRRAAALARRRDALAARLQADVAAAQSEDCGPGEDIFGEGVDAPRGAAGANPPGPAAAGLEAAGAGGGRGLGGPQGAAPKFHVPGRTAGRSLRCSDRREMTVPFSQSGGGCRGSARCSNTVLLVAPDAECAGPCSDAPSPCDRREGWGYGGSAQREANQRGHRDAGRPRVLRMTLELWRPGGCGPGEDFFAAGEDALGCARGPRQPSLPVARTHSDADPALHELIALAAKRSPKESTCGELPEYSVQYEAWLFAGSAPARDAAWNVAVEFGRPDGMAWTCSVKTALVASNSVPVANLSGSLEAMGSPHSAADKG